LIKRGILGYSSCQTSSSLELLFIKLFYFRLVKGFLLEWG
jgi:hypothetical protein